MRNLTQDFKTTASGDHNRPVELIDLYLDTTTYYFVANNTESISFFNAASGDAAVYQPVPGSRSSAKSSLGLDIDRVRVGISNVDKSLVGYLQANEFRGRRIVIRQVFTNVLGSSGDAVTIFDGLMDSPAVDDKWLSINVVPRISSLKKKAPHIWYQLPCNWRFGGEECGVNVADAAYSKSKTCDADCTTTELKGVDVTEADRYWRRGYVRFTSGQNDGYRQTVDTSIVGQITLDNPMPYAPAVGDTYTVRTGCDKTLFMCSGDYGNEANFGGFHTIPENMVIK